jgi:acetyl esterase/lipase
MSKPRTEHRPPLIAACALLVLAGTPLRAVDLAHYQPATAAAAVLEDHYPQLQTQFPWGVTGLAALTYVTIPGYRPLSLDLYLPGHAGHGPLPRRPLIIYLHGGGWFSGHSRQSGAFENWPEVLASIAARGYVVSSVNYRLSGEAPFPAAIQDVKSAIRWLRAHADEYGIDKTRVLVWGGSAGGQLAALTATSCGNDALEPATAAAPGATAPALESDCVQAAITWYGIFDFAPLVKQPAPPGPASAPNAAPAPNPVWRYLGCSAGGCTPETIALASAITQVSKSTPPMLLLHGTQDRTVPFAQSQAFHDALQAAGDQVQLIPIVGAGHSFVAATAADTRAASLRALSESLRFMDATVGQRR